MLKVENAVRLVTVTKCVLTDETEERKEDEEQSECHCELAEVGFGSVQRISRGRLR